MLFYQLLSTRQLEMCEIGNGPMILQRVGDNRQQLAGGGYNGFAGSAPPPHAFLKPVPEGAVPFGDQGARDQGSASQFVAPSGDAAVRLAPIGLFHARHQSKGGRQLIAWPQRLGKLLYPVQAPTRQLRLAFLSHTHQKTVPVQIDPEGPLGTGFPYLRMLFCLGLFFCMAPPG